MTMACMGGLRPPHRRAISPDQYGGQRLVDGQQSTVNGQRESRGSRQYSAGLALALALVASPLHAQAAPAVATPPVLGPAPRLVMPAVQAATLPNGVRLQVVSMTELPLVQMTLLIDGGARLDGSHPGLASFAASMLSEGAGGRDVFELAAGLEYLGASLSAGASWDNFSLSLRAPKRTIADAARILADELLRPSFRSQDVARRRDLRIADLLQARDRPSAVANNVFGYEVFPSGHPYHNPIAGDSASVATFDSAMVRRFWTGAAVPSRATLIVTGDVTLAEARALATSALGGWAAPATPLALAPAASTPAAPVPSTRVFLVDKPGAAQSVILIGRPGVDRRSPDYAALTLMNTLFGGSFSSRINQILREQKGFTYGAGSSFSWRPVPGPFVASSAVRTNVTDSSLAIFFSEFRRLRSEPVSAAELDRARSYIGLGALGDFETTRQVAGALADLDQFGLPLSTIPADLDAIGKLTTADIQRAAEKYVDPGRMTVVVVGDIAKIRPGIEALHLGPVTVVDHAGREVTP
jgi:predicted Zn-dependent peptidase